MISDVGDIRLVDLFYLEVCFNDSLVDDHFQGSVDAHLSGDKIIGGDSAVVNSIAECGRTGDFDIRRNGRQELGHGSVAAGYSGHRIGKNIARYVQRPAVVAGQQDIQIAGQVEVIIDIQANLYVGELERIEALRYIDSFLSQIELSRLVVEHAADRTECQP